MTLNQKFKDFLLNWCFLILFIIIINVLGYNYIEQSFKIVHFSRPKISLIWIAKAVPERALNEHVC
jgi:TRAP-type mannitol/chloroaromatic compound transport system permease small subunit